MQDYITDYITIERIWQEEYFFQIKITASSDTITATTKVYLQDQHIDDLSDRIKEFIDGNIEECYWETAEKGVYEVSSISMSFFNKDKLGHIKIEVYMELDDGGICGSHNCCFYVNTELGQLEEFGKKLYEVKEHKLGKVIVLNQF